MNKCPQIAAARNFIGIDVAKEARAVFVDGTQQHFTCVNEVKEYYPHY